MNENTYSSQKNLTESDEGGEKPDLFTKRLDMVLKALITIFASIAAIASTLGPILAVRYNYQYKEEIKKEASANAVVAQEAVGEAKTAVNQAKTAVDGVTDSLKKHDERLESVDESTAYTKAVTAEWWADRTGSQKAAVQAEKARARIGDMNPDDIPPLANPK